MKVVVTGGSGLLGKWVIKELLEHDYEVINADIKRPVESQCHTMLVNLENLGQVYGVLAGADAVIHLGAIPNPLSDPHEVVFRNNVISTYHVLEAAAGLGIQKAAIASSESSYGFAFSYHPFSPHYFPLDENHPQLSQDCYGLSKIVNEETAHTFQRQTGMQVVSFRFGHVISPEQYEHYRYWLEPEGKEERKKTFWGYIDVRDAASACRLALEAEGLGSVALNIEADDTFSDLKTDELLASYFPDVSVRASLGDYQALISNQKAKKLLNWKPVHSWRNEVKG